MRKDPAAHEWFLDAIFPMIVGCSTHKKVQAVDAVSAWLRESSQAFGYLALTNYDLVLMTSEGEAKPVGCGQRMERKP